MRCCFWKEDPAAAGDHMNKQILQVPRRHRLVETRDEGWWIIESWLGIAGCLIKFKCHENAGSAICEDKLICGLANKTIPANKLIFYVGISMFAQIRPSVQMTLFIKPFVKNKVSAKTKVSDISVGFWRTKNEHTSRTYHHSPPQPPPSNPPPFISSHKTTMSQAPHCTKWSTTRKKTFVVICVLLHSYHRWEK